jgi:hypothetical protein
MAIKVFLLGRPGSGKTTAFYNIEKIAHKKKKKVLRLREYPILRDMAHQDGYKDKFRLIEGYDGFDILDFSVFNESASHLEKQIQSYLSSSKGNELIFIELARDDYSKAMNCFSPEFLKDAYILFIEADVETCLKRIHHRVAHPKKTDGHYVSDYIVKSYYSKNNMPYMSDKFRLDYRIRKRVMVIKNTDSPREFAKKTKHIAKIIFALEFSNTGETVKRQISNTGETGLNPLLVLMFSLITFPLVILAIPTFIDNIHVLTDVPLFIYLPGIITGFLLLASKYLPSSWFTNKLAIMVPTLRLFRTFRAHH